jgi:hypothetical protein
MLALSALLGGLSIFVPELRGTELGDLMGPLLAMLAFQGLAVVHGLVARTGASVAWLIGAYLLLLMPPHFGLPALLLVGLTDGWIDFRARVREKS